MQILIYYNYKLLNWPAKFIDLKIKMLCEYMNIYSYVLWNFYGGIMIYALSIKIYFLFLFLLLAQSITYLSLLTNVIKWNTLYPKFIFVYSIGVYRLSASSLLFLVRDRISRSFFISFKNINVQYILNKFFCSHNNILNNNHLCQFL